MADIATPSASTSISNDLDASSTVAQASDSPSGSNTAAPVSPPAGAGIPPEGCHFQGCTKKGDKRCAGCKTVYYCSGEHQKQDWTTHKLECKKIATKPLAPGFLSRAHSSPYVPSFRVFCEDERIKPDWNKDGHDWLPHDLPHSDPIFSLIPQPLTQLIGFPLVMRKANLNGDVPDTDGMWNKPARWLSIDVETGETPKEWKKKVGTVYVARADRGPLNEYQFEAAWRFCEDIGDRFGFTTKASKAIKSRYNRATFEEFYKELRRIEQKQHRWEKAPKTLEGDV